MGVVDRAQPPPSWDPHQPSCQHPPPVPGSGVRCGLACWDLGFGLRSATPWGGVGMCVCSCAPSSVVFCTSWLGVLCGGVLLVPRPATLGRGVGLCVCLCPRPACSPPFLARVCCVGVRAGPGSRLCPAILGWVVGVCFSGGGRVLLWLCGVGRRLFLSRALWSLPPHPLSFGLGCWLFFFFRSSVVCVCAFWVSLFPMARCCWPGVAVSGWVVPLCPFGRSCLQFLLGRGFGRLLRCWWAVWWW